ncbi:unnamed protein product [Blepharisma stoltei]|uniref:Serine/threonine-protein kinase ATR n=1 Tax=Blepharisma stoltei TaxID=1481888 RepID=A0AAU9J394_9CILI|nr:unnamed protein product [Blepharisma stoltei]
MSDNLVDKLEDCTHLSCDSTLMDLIIDIKWSDDASIQEFERLYHSFEAFTIKGKYTGSCWRDLMYFLLELLSKPQYQSKPFESVLAIFINDTFSDQLQFHFLQDTLRIIKSLAAKAENISFKFSKLRIHEECYKDNCKKFPCCTTLNCQHKEIQFPKDLIYEYRGEEAFIKANFLIQTIAALYEGKIVKNIQSPILENFKSQIIDVLRNSIGCKGIAFSCIKALTRLHSDNSIGITSLLENEYFDKAIENDPNILKFIDKEIIINFTQIALAKWNFRGRNIKSSQTFPLKPLVNACCTALLSEPTKIKLFSLPQMIANYPEFIWFYLLLAKKSLNNFDETIEIIMNRIQVSQNTSKAIKSDNGQKIPLRTYELDLRRPLKCYNEDSSILNELCKHLQITIENTSYYDLLFWYGLSNNIYIKELIDGIETPNQNSYLKLEVAKFRAYCGKTYSVSDPLDHFKVLPWYKGSDYSFIPSLIEFFNPNSDWKQLFLLNSILPIEAFSYPDHIPDLKNYISEVMNRAEWNCNFSKKNIKNFVKSVLFSLPFLDLFSESVDNQWQINFLEINTWTCINCESEINNEICNNCGGCNPNFIYSDRILIADSQDRRNIVSRSSKSDIGIENFYSRTIEKLANFYENYSCNDIIKSTEIQLLLCYRKYANKWFGLRFSEQSLKKLVSLPLSLKLNIFPIDWLSIGGIKQCSKVTQDIMNELIQSIESNTLSRKAASTIIKLIDNESLKTFKYILELIEILFNPCPAKKLAKNSLKSLSYLFTKLNIDLLTALDFLPQEYIFQWCLKTLECNGFFGFLLKIFKINPQEFSSKIMMKFQSVAFVSENADHLKIYEIIGYISKETQTNVTLLYSNILVEIAWKKDPSLMFRLEKAASLFMTGNSDSALTIGNLFNPEEIGHIFEGTSYLLLNKFGMSDVNSTKWMMNKNFGLSTEVSLDESSIQDFFDSFCVIKSLFRNNEERLSQQPKNLQQFSWEDFLPLAGKIEEFVLPSDVFKINVLIGIAKICLALLDGKDCLPYLVHKIISICSALMILEPKAVLEILERIINKPCWNIVKDHCIAIISLAFSFRKISPKAEKILSTVLNKISIRDIDDPSSLIFICLPMLFSTNFTCVEALWNKIKNKANIECELYFSLANAIKSNFPILQYAGLSIIEEAINKCSFNFKSYVALALNKATSLQSSRDNIQELPIPLGQLIDEMTGKIGAIANGNLIGISENFVIEKPTKFNIKTIKNIMEQVSQIYCSSERIYYGELRLKDNMTENEEIVLEVLDGMFMKEYSSLTNEPCFNDMKSLREWSQWLIHSSDNEEFFPILNLIDISLEVVADILPHALALFKSKQDYFLRYVTDFLQNTNAGHKRLMLRILEKTEMPIYSLLNFPLKMNLLIDLQEFPKAWNILELSIRSRISSTKKRYSPRLLTKEEVEWCRTIYVELAKNRYINAIPEVLELYSISQDDDKNIQNIFSSGNYFILNSWNFSFSINPLVFGAAWRLGKPRECYSICHIESLIGNILFALLNNQSVELAINKARKIWIAQSSTRSASYAQAYDHALFQHIIENIILLTNKNNLEYYPTVCERNSHIEQKFEYVELVERVTLVISSNRDNCISACLDSIRKILKVGILEYKYEYCRNFLKEIFSIYPKLNGHLLNYYKYKVDYLSEREFLFSKELKAEMKAIEPNKEKDPKNANIPNICLKYKYALLVIRVKCRSGLNLSHNAEKYIEKYFDADNDQNFEIVRLYIEKGFNEIASFIDNNLVNFKVSEENAESAALAAIFYAKSLYYGHARYHSSMTRALSLYFALNRLLSENELIDKLNDIMGQAAEEFPIFIWADCVHQILAEIEHPKASCREVVNSIILRLLIQHPQQMSWLIFGLADKKYDRDGFFNHLLSQYEKICGRKLLDSLEANKSLMKEFVTLAKADHKKAGISKKMQNLKNVSLAMPIQENFLVKKYPKTLFCLGNEFPGFTLTPVCIERVSEEITIMPSKAKPKKISMIGSDGVRRYFLCKYERSSDMRKESRVASIIETANRILEKDPKAKRLGIRFPSYSLIPIGSDCGIVEWVENTATLKSIITQQWLKNGIKLDVASAQKLHPSKDTYNPDLWEILQRTIRPCLHQYFYDKFPHHNNWLNARLKFTRSLASWSMFGYIIGLGDRHCDNILMFNDTGELMLIDFECIFNMGTLLPKPEVVPFRLTPELQDAMGLFFEDGEFTYTCEIVLKCFQNNKAVLLSQFESFISDPLNCPIKNPEISRNDESVSNTLKIVEARLDRKKQVNSEMYYTSTLQQVKSLIKEATDTENLRVMFYGWMPWM